MMFSTKKLIWLYWNGDEIDYIETQAYGPSNKTIHANEEIKLINIKKQFKTDEFWWSYRRKQKRT